MKLLLALSVITLAGCASGPTPEEQLASQQAEIARFASICGEIWDTDAELDACMNRRMASTYAPVPARVERSSNTAAIIGAILLGGAQGYSRGLQENTYVIPDYTPPPPQERDYTNPKTGQVIRTTGTPPMGFY